MKKFFIVSGSIVLFAGILAVCLFISNPHNHKYIGEISTPMDYERVEAKNGRNNYISQQQSNHKGHTYHNIV